jgi:hypothetical protein
MEIAGWFDGLKPVRQESIRSKVQKWSVSALVQLSKVAEKFLESVINGGKKTAAQVKQALASLAPSSIKKAPTQSLKAPVTSSVEQVELAPGMRIVVKTNDAYNGSTGEIKEKDGNNFWVLLDYTAANGGVARMLFKPEQLAPESKIVKSGKSESEQLAPEPKIAIKNKSQSERLLGKKQHVLQSNLMNSARFLPKKEIRNYSNNLMPLNLS